MKQDPQNQLKYRNFFWCLLAAITFFRLFLAGRLGLGVDESHYLMFARNLAWGYFDHPPMVAFVTALTTGVSDSLWFVRIGPILLWMVSLIFLRALALTIYKDERVAFYSLVLLLLMPLHHALGFVLLPDSPLNMFWCASLLFSWHAVREGKWHMWLLTGIMFGGALLSKYHGVLLPVCLFLYLITSQEDRHWLRSPKPYVAFLLGLVVFLPNIIWNARHQWISYAYQLGHGGGERALSMENLGEAIGGQVVAASPILFFMLIAAYIVLIRNRPLTNANAFVLWTSLPIFFFFCSIGLFGKILPHWTAIGWWTGSLALASVALKKIDERNRSGRRWARWTVAGGVLGAIMILGMHLGLFFPVVTILHNNARDLTLKLNQRFPVIQPLDPFKPRHDTTNDLFGWEEAATRVEEIRAAMPNPDKTFVFCNRFFTTSQLTVYLASGTVATSLHPGKNQYRLWFDIDDYTGWDALYVDDDRFMTGYKQYSDLFDKGNENPEEINLLRHGVTARTLRIYKYYDFSGKYDNW